MRKFTLLLLAVVFCFSSLNARADDRDTAVSLVKKAVAFYKANGPEKLIEEVSNSKGPFVDGAFYVFVMDKDAVMIAHPMNTSLIGQPQVALRDVDGKYFAKEMVEMAKTKGSGWTDYRFKNPKTGELSPKSSYVELVEDLVIGCGVYRK